jgi:hypothetical protein
MLRRPPADRPTPRWGEDADPTCAAGKIGLWTMADSVTCFDNVRVTALPEREGIHEVGDA